MSNRGKGIGLRDVRLSALTPQQLFFQADLALTAAVIARVEEKTPRSIAAVYSLHRANSLLEEQARRGHETNGGIAQAVVDKFLNGLATAKDLRWWK